MNKYSLQPSRSIVWKTALGKVIATPCTCTNRIPGLDAEFCLTCRIYWVDESEAQKTHRRVASQEEFEERLSQLKEDFAKKYSIPGLYEMMLKAELENNSGYYGTH